MEREPPRPSAGRRPSSVSGAFRTSGSCSARSNDWCAHPSAMLHGCQEPSYQTKQRNDELTARQYLWVIERTQTTRVHRLAPPFASHFSMPRLENLRLPFTRHLLTLTVKGKSLAC